MNLDFKCKTAHEWEAQLQLLGRDEPQQEVAGEVHNDAAEHRGAGAAAVLDDPRRDVAEVADVGGQRERLKSAPKSAIFNAKLIILNTKFVCFTIKSLGLGVAEGDAPRTASNLSATPRGKQGVCVGVPVFSQLLGVDAERVHRASADLGGERGHEHDPAADDDLRAVGVDELIGGGVLRDGFPPRGELGMRRGIRHLSAADGPRSQVGVQRRPGPGGWPGRWTIRVSPCPASWRRRLPAVAAGAPRSAVGVALRRSQLLSGDAERSWLSVLRAAPRNLRRRRIEPAAAPKVI